MKACLISAPMTGAGKTTVTLGLLAALRRRGTAVQPFKVGPDFIDPGLHELAAGVPSHNLDGWMVSREQNQLVFAQACEGQQVAVVEGVMGLYDGFDGSSESGSSAEMALWLDLPVILVVDASPLGRGIAAIVQGLRDFDRRVKIAGLLLNRVAGEGHYRLLAEALRDVPVLGWLPPDPAIEIPERHLGLFTAREDLPKQRIEAIGDFFEQHVNVGELLDKIPDVQVTSHGSRVTSRLGTGLATRDWRPATRIRVALAHDKAFSFYYRANRFELERTGAHIIEFSPLVDKQLPDADILYIGGGYPELYRRELEANASMRTSVRNFIESGKRFYAECGGLMYLAQSIDGSRMVGVLPTEIEMTGRLVDFGYAEITTNRPSIWGPAGMTARGHQFHYSRATRPSDEPIYTIKQRGRASVEGFAFPNGIASYVHLHFLSNVALAENMLDL